jgi:hypothetical protein
VAIYAVVAGGIIQLLRGVPGLSYRAGHCAWSLFCCSLVSQCALILAWAFDVTPLEWGTEEAHTSDPPDKRLCVDEECIL